MAQPQGYGIGRRLTRTIASMIAMALALMGVVAGAAPANSAGEDFLSTLEQWGVTYTWTYQTAANPPALKNTQTTAVLGTVGIEADPAVFYCIEYSKGIGTRQWGPLDLYATAKSLGLTDAEIQRMSWVLTHGYTRVPGTGSTLQSLLPNEDLSTIDPKIQDLLVATATQAAIWNISDKLTFVGTSGPNRYGTLIAAASQKLLAGAAAWQATATTNPVQLADYPANPVSISPSPKSGVSGERVGPFTVNTGTGTATVSYAGGASGTTLVDATGAVVADGTVVQDGTVLYVQVPKGTAPGTGTINLTGQVGLRTTAWSYPNNQTGSGPLAQPANIASATVNWAPPIIATLAHEKGQPETDKELPFRGGTLTDKVTYSGLTPGVDYVLKGSIVRFSDGRATGIVATQRFTASATGSGTVNVDFTVPVGYAGQTLVVYETLFASDGTTELASHRDLKDTAQTFSVAPDNTRFDLALRKTLATGQSAKVSVGDTVKFTITVFNQGNIAAQNILITDTLPPGTELADTAWTTGPDANQAQRTIAGPLAVGGSTSVDIAVKVTDAKASYVNNAEIADAQDDLGRYPVDIDSTPDNDPTNDKLIDDEIDKTPPADEDDHDIATVEIESPKLATSATDKADGDKTLDVTGGVVVDTVTYSNVFPGTYVLKGELFDKATGQSTGITATRSNLLVTAPSGSTTLEFVVPGTWAGHTLVAFETLTQRDGTVVAEHKDINDAAQTVTVTPETPKIQLTKLAKNVVDANNNGRQDAGDTIEYTFEGTNTGNVTLTKVVVTDPKFPGKTFPCTPSTLPPGASAECGSAVYTLTQADIDRGTVNNTATIQGTPPSGPNVTDDDSTTTPLKPVFDLALRKTLASGQRSSVAVGDKVTFTVTVFNQGDVTATDIVVTDTLPAGTALADNTWTAGAAGQVSRTIAGPLAAGASIAVPITLTITSPQTGYLNTAEISAAKGVDGTPVTDVDSTPDTNPTNDKLIDDEITKTPATGDEDDHDVAKVTPLVSIGDFVWWDTNSNGQQDQGEAPVAGVTVNLYDADNKLIATTTTNADGFYSFTGLPAGAQVTVEFVRPAGTQFTIPTTGDAAGDSDANPTTGRVTLTTPTSGSNSASKPDNPTIDAGLIQIPTQPTPTQPTPTPIVTTSVAPAPTAQAPAPQGSAGPGSGSATPTPAPTKSPTAKTTSGGGGAKGPNSAGGAVKGKAPKGKSLPSTGSPVSPVALALTLGLILGGLALLLVARRRSNGSR